MKLIRKVYILFKECYSKMSPSMCAFYLRILHFVLPSVSNLPRFQSTFEYRNLKIELNLKSELNLKIVKY